MAYQIKHTTLAAAMLLALNAPLYSPQALAAPGDKVANEFPVNTFTTNVQRNSKIAMDADGDFVITWQSYNQINVLSSYDIYAQRYNADGSTAGDEFLVNTVTTNIQRNPNIAMDADGDFVITWQSYNQIDASSGDDIYAQRYTADGSKVGTEFPVNTFTTNRQEKPDIAMDADGDFVITWSSYNQASPTSPNDIYAQRYTADGNKAGIEILINTTTTNNQNSPSIAMDADGDFVIAWTETGSNNIFAQRYTADGSKAGTELTVSTTPGNKKSPSVAMDTNGDFIITWEGNGSDDSSGVYAQRYNANGSVADSEFIVNTTTINSQGNPNIAMDTDGDFIVTWDGNGTGDVNGVFAQRFEGTGDTIDLSLVVNNDTDPVTTGNNFTYSLITTNKSSDIAMDINLSEPLPTGLTYVSDDSATAGWNCSVASTTLECNLPFMNPSASSTINVTVTADNAGTINNVVTVSSAQTDSDTSDNSDTETTEVTAPADTVSSGGGGGGSLGWLSGLLLLPFFLRRKNLSQKLQSKY